MHLVIPFAAPLSAAGREALLARPWQRLNQLLQHTRLVQRHDGDEFSYSPPHEHALAQALAWVGADGCLPFAARQAVADGLDAGTRAWGLVTPTHWRLGAEHVSLADPASVPLDESDSRALFEAVRGLFTGAGYGLEWGHPQRWYATHESLVALPTASLDRAGGRNVDHWLLGAQRDQADARVDATRRHIRRLQSEVQMLLYEHPVNQAREARGLLAVNSFWLSGCGVAQTPALGSAQGSGSAAPEQPVVDMRLVAPALAEDWPAWRRAWDALEAGPLQQWQLTSASTSASASTAPAPAPAPAGAGSATTAPAPALLTLCGERGWAQFAPAPKGLWARTQSWFKPNDVRAVLESL
jgi:hypothetical protein